MNIILITMLIGVGFCLQESQSTKTVSCILPTAPTSGL